MLALHSTQRTPSWLLRHRKAFERDVMSSGVLFHLSSGQAPSTTQGADSGLCSEHSPTPCHGQSGLGRANSTIP